jgi:hypothetical protein
LKVHVKVPEPEAVAVRCILVPSGKVTTILIAAPARVVTLTDCLAPVFTDLWPIATLTKSGGGVLVAVGSGVVVGTGVAVDPRVGTGVAVAVGASGTVAVGVGPEPLPVTTIVAIISGWIAQWYGYVPGVLKIVPLELVPAATTPASQTLVSLIGA